MKKQGEQNWWFKVKANKNQENEDVKNTENRHKPCN